MMRDTVRKLVPYFQFEIDALEAWLEELAREGLVLTDLSGPFAKFTQGEPREIRYRIGRADYGRWEDREAKYIEGCEELGWEYVASFPDGYLIFRTEDENAEEFHTDRAVLEKSMTRRIRLEIVVSIFLIALWAFNISQLNVFHSEDLLVHMVEYGFFIVPYGITMLLLGCGVYFGRIVALVKMKKRLRSGEALEHKSPYKSTRVRGIIPIVLLAAALIWIGYTVVQNHTRNRVDRYLIETYEYDYNFPLLDEINAGEGEAVRAGYDNDYVTFYHTELAPVIVKVYQYGNRIEPDAEPGYTPRRAYTVEYYELRSEWLAEKYFEKKAAVFGDGGAEEIAYSGLDAVLYDVGNTSNGQYLLIRKGNIVVIVRYVGDSSLPDYLDFYAAYLEGGHA